MTDVSGRTVANRPPTLPPLAEPAAVPDVALCSIEDLTGFDLQAIRKAIGMPLVAALDKNDESAMYAWYWRAKVRHDQGVEFDDVMSEPFSAILAAFTAANGGGVDPIVARNGDA